MIEETKKQQHNKIFKQLSDDFESWKGHFRDITDYMMPRKGRYLSGDQVSQHNDGSKKHQKIINGSAYDALRIISAGMQGGMTSPSRPWFVLALPDESLMEYAPVRDWLHMVRNAMLTVMARSNFYGSIHSQYMELAAYGTASMLIQEDFSTVIRCRPFTIGEYYLSLDKTYRVDTLYRQYALTARQMVDEFGIDNVSRPVKDAYESNKVEIRFDVIHCIQPNQKVDLSRDDYRGMPFESFYYEPKGDDDKTLREAGYREKPFVASRWDVTGVDIYGESPGMAALGDMKMLQKMEEKKLKALDKMVDPPMNADINLKKQGGGTIVAGDVNYIDGMSQGIKGFTPAYQVSPDMQNIAYEIDRVEMRIRRFFFNDLFLSILSTDKRMTATEVAERHEEKLLMLGPVLERLQAELLDEIIVRTYSIMDRQGLIPEVPEEMKGMEMKIEYISLLAQAQKMVGTTAIEQTVGFAGNLAAVNPEVVDKIDFDEAIDQYADMVGVPPKIIRSDDKVLEIRENRAQQQQAAAAQEQAALAADGAKTLSETKLEGNSALDSLMENVV